MSFDEEVQSESAQCGGRCGRHVGWTDQNVLIRRNIQSQVWYQFVLKSNLNPNTTLLMLDHVNIIRQPFHSDSSTALATGSRVTLVGLQRAAHLNNRKGIIISAPVQPSTRYQVYLFRTSNDWSSEPVFVRAQPANINPIPANSSNHTNTPRLTPRPTPRIRPSLPPPHPLRTLPRHHILDTIPTRIAPTTNFFGTVPPSYLLCGVPLNAKSVRILVLACGDIRSVFYTVSRRTAAHGRLPKLRLILNDNEPSIIARNILLLWLVTRTTLDPPTIYEIWFSLRLSARAYAAVVEAISALTGPHSRRELHRIGLTFHSDADRTAVYRFFHAWITWKDHFKPDVLLADRKEVMNAMYGTQTSSSEYPQAEELAFRHHVVGDATFPKDVASREIKQYMNTGCVAFKHPQEYLNPTLFKSPDEYTLHMESIPFNAFPPFAPHYDKNTPLRTTSLNHLRQWVCAMRRHAGNNEYIVSTTDCLEFAIASTERFDIIAMSNITDVVGLLPILQATRGLLVPSGYMFTQTFKSTKYKGYIEGYLRTTLGLPLEFVPAVLGWRCVGWEGKNNPDHCVVKEAPGSDGRSCETRLTWQPAAATNVPLDVAACEHASRLYKTIRDRLWTPLRSHPEDIADGMLLLRVVNPLTLIPVFASACGVEKVIGSGTSNKDVEFGDVLRFITTGTPNDLVLASVAIPRRPLQVWAFEPTDPRDIFTVRLDSGVPYTAIRMHLREETGKWALTWIMSRERARGVEKGCLMYSGSVVIQFSVNDMSFSELSRDQWSSWLNRTSSSSSGAVKVRRVERDDSCDIILDIPRDCIDAARSDKLIVRRDQHYNHSIEMIINIDHMNSQKQIFHLPYPIENVRAGLDVQAGKKAKFEVLKAKYSFESLFLPDSNNTACSFQTTSVPQPYVTWLVTQQFSPNELLRSELGKLQWTSLCACKSISSSILMTAGNGHEGPIYLQNEDEETGRTQALVLFIKAMRRDECTGNLAADVKWMHKPILVSPRVLRHQANCPSHAPMTSAEFQAVLKMLEVRSDHEPETERVRDGGDFLMKSEAMCREFPGLLKSISSDDDHDTPERSKIQDRMHLLCGGRIGYATVTVLMWPGQVALLEREGNSLVSTFGMDYKDRVEGWLKRGYEHKRRGDMEFALLAFEQGAGQGLSILRLGQPVSWVDALVECLLEAAAVRLGRSDERNYALISACCNKAIELIGNCHSPLQRQAERLLSKAVDASQS